MDLYLKKKEQLNSGSQKVFVADAKTEIEKQRSASPAPLQRSSSVIPRDKKVVYKTDLEDHKKQMNDDLVAHKNSLTVDYMQRQADSLNQVNELKSSIDQISKTLESTKTENLKNALNQCVQKCNDNIREISAEMTKLLVEIESLKSRIDAVESLF